MNKTQSNRLSMFKAVLAVMDSSSEIISSVPIINQFKTELAGYIKQIESKGLTVTTSTSGKTLAKVDAREVLSDLLLKMGSSIYSYAKRKNIQDAMSICEVSRTRLARMKENDYVIKTDAIIEKLKQYKDSLSDYGVTDEKIRLLESLLEDFKTAADLKDTGSANKTAAYDSLEQLFINVNELFLHELDGMVEHFSKTYPEFYSAYFSARTVKDLGRHHANNTPAEQEAEVKA